MRRYRRDDGQVQVAFIAIKPSPARRHLLASVRDANRRIERAAALLEGVSYIDVFTPMLDADGQPRGDLFLDDQLHLNAAGYALWTRIVGAAIGAGPAAR